mgnify:CR=1 FL=1
MIACIYKEHGKNLIFKTGGVDGYSYDKIFENKLDGVLKIMVRIEE